ncbi:hypothetical protein CgunFtcFv8_027033 [Champsocephalus gunnari]|uniref:Uncharacterized protein n=1 Tax=Champsocephalus gunnari TaxID=52237 RepID=A0AAN8DWX6_CHAGU|nr:hypothetical protein CgunFtcFv8_027033 [Champsocephalus gunnari]
MFTVVTQPKSEAAPFSLDLSSLCNKQSHTALNGPPPPPLSSRSYSTRFLAAYGACLTPCQYKPHPQAQLAPPPSSDQMAKSKRVGPVVGGAG